MLHEDQTHLTIDMFGSAVVFYEMNADLSDDVWRRVAPFISTINLGATAGSCRRLKQAMGGLLDLRKGMCACGCLSALRDQEEDFPVYDGDEGRPQELRGGTVRINCIWNRNVNVPTHHCRSVAMLYSWGHIDNEAFRGRSGWHKSRSRKWHCRKCRPVF